MQDGGRIGNLLIGFLDIDYVVMATEIMFICASKAEIWSI